MLQVYPLQNHELPRQEEHLQRETSNRITEKGKKTRAKEVTSYDKSTIQPKRKKKKFLPKNYHEKQ
jgi:hypothetical protein